jgi:hypothetical protein
MVVWASVFSSGCGRTEPVTFAHWVAPEIEEVRRIVLVPFQTPGTSDKAEIVGRQLGAALRQQGRFEVMMLLASDAPALSAPGSWESNRIDPSVLRDLSSRYNCDAVLIGRIDRWQPYDPVAIGLQIHLVHAGSGAVVWSVGGDFDSRTQSIQDALATWWDNTHGSGQASISGWRAALSSPRLYATWLSEALVTSASYGEAPPPDDGKDLFKKPHS